MSSGAEALRRALAQPGNRPPPKGTPKRAPVVHAAELEDRLVDEAFRLLEKPIKGWLRRRFRHGTSLRETVDKFAGVLETANTILEASSAIAAGVRAVRKKGG